MTRPALEFWFEFASTYSYLSAMRIEDAAREAGVDIAWKPFLLGPIFRRQGWSTSPFNLYPAKGRYMVRDVARLAGERGLAFRMPDPFPQNGLLAARLTLAGHDEGWGTAFARAVFTAEFAQGQPIGEAETLARILAGLGVEAAPAMMKAATDDIKMRLRRQTDEAEAKGIFGAPSFVTPDGELFWGDDRLEQALRWAAKFA